MDLDALTPSVHRVTVLLALASGSGGPARFGAVAAPFVAVTGLDGSEVASYTITDLEAESAVVALELYRRQGVWKVRAVGQGYAGGLAELLTDQGLPQAQQLAGSIHEAVAHGLARSVAAPPPRLADADRPRQTAAPAPGPDQAQSGTTSQGLPGNTSPQQGDHPTSPYGTTPAYGSPPDATLADHASAQHGGPAPGDPSVGTQPAASTTGGPVNYSHPGRQTTAPPPPPPTAPPALPGQPARPVAGDATGWSMEERLYNQVWGMFEDLARTTAAYRSAVDFAESRMEQELDKVLSDPRSRISGRGDAAREAARAKHAQLVDQARDALDRDLAQLGAEADVVEPALPPAFASWNNPVWHGYRVPMEIPMALRLGDLHLPESEDVRIPMLVRLPLERGLWIDSGRSGSRGSLVDSDELRRLRAGHGGGASPRGCSRSTRRASSPSTSSTRPGRARPRCAPLVGAGVLAGPPAAGAAGVSDVLGRLTQRVDLVQMAVRGGASDALPPGLGHGRATADRQRLPARLRRPRGHPAALSRGRGSVRRRPPDDGRRPAGSPAYGPLLDPLWRSLMRLTPVPDDHLADPWVGHAWTYEPSSVPPGSRVMQQVLAQVAAARRSWNR